MSLYVLDTFAVMSYLRREPGHEKVRNVILENLSGASASHMSVINLGELYYMQSRKSGAATAESSVKFVGRAGISIEPATTDRVMAAARLKARISMSYADAFAASLAGELGAILVTGDPEYKPLESSIDIFWI